MGQQLERLKGGVQLKKSAQFRCPHCQTVLTKCEIDQVLGEAGSFMVFGQSTEICPACGNPIDRLSIVNGKYDIKKSALESVLQVILTLAILIAMIWLLGQCGK